MRDSRQTRSTRGYLTRLITKRERKQARLLLVDVHKMVGNVPTQEKCNVTKQ